MTDFEKEKIKVHPELKILYQQAICCESCKICVNNEYCIQYVSCGEPCKPFPCKQCIVWEGYGITSKKEMSLLKKMLNNSTI